MKYKELWQELVKSIVDRTGSNDYSTRVASFARGMCLLDGEEFTVDGKKFRVKCDDGILTVRLVLVKGKKSKVCWETELSEEDIALVSEFAEKGWYISEKRGEILYEFLKGLGFKVE